MKAIESFSFSARKGNASKQDWNTLFNGSIWMMESGIDFTTKPLCFVALAKRYAKNMGFGLRIGRDGDNVIIQAYKMQATEIAAPASEVDECPVEEAEMDLPTTQEQQEQQDYIENAAMGFAPAAPKTRRKRS